MEDEQRVGLPLGILEVPGAPAALLHPKVLLQVVDDKDIDIFEPQGERVFTIGGLVAQPGRIRDELPAARAHAVLVDHRHRGVQAHVLEPHVDVGRRLADPDRLGVPFVAVDRDVQPVRAGSEPVDVQRGGAEELAIEEHGRAGHVAADAQHAGGAGRGGGCAGSAGSRTGAGRSAAAGRLAGWGRLPFRVRGAAAPSEGRAAVSAGAGGCRRENMNQAPPAQTAAPSTITSSIGPRRDVGGGSSSNTLMRARVYRGSGVAVEPFPVVRATR